MRFGSVCSGIEAASVAWHPLGWRPMWFAEIDAFPSAVLKARWPDVPNLGDFTQIGSDAERIDVLVGGTPCQSFSIAGLRAGLGDERGNLALEFLRLAQRLSPKWVVWENVPGVLSSNGGRDFGAILGGLAELRYGWAYRVLDAQYFGVAQRRRRVFVVGCLGDWRLAAAVLFERYSMSGHPAPRRKAGKDVAGVLDARTTAGGFPGTDGATDGHVVAFGGNRTSGSIDVAAALQAHGGPHSRLDFGSETFLLVADPISANEAHTYAHGGNNAGRLHNVIPVLEVDGRANINIGREGIGIGKPGDPMYTLKSGKQNGIVAARPRRLTPRECERLMGFPDDYTAITYRGKPAADGPRYRALGNSMAVPVMSWIGKRISQLGPNKKEGTAA